MKFKTVQEAFNHYKNSSLKEIEKRTSDIKSEIQNNHDVDIDYLNIELDGLKEAKTNALERASEQEHRSNNFNPVTGMNFDSTHKNTAEDIFNSREYRSAFCKTMLNQPLDGEESAIFQKANSIMANEKRASFINTSEAAAVIPTQMLNEIFQKAVEMGGILPLCRRFDIPSNLAVPVATPEDAAEWHTEGDEVEPDNKKPTNIIFNGFELMKVFSISAAARSMSISAYESYLQSELSRVMITALQKAVVSGTGSGQPTGLLTGIIWGTANSVSNADMEFATFLKAASLLKSGYNTSAVWAMNNATLYNSIMSITDGIDRPLLYEARDGNANRILGKPVILDDFLPDNTVLFGDFKYYGINYPQNILLEVSRDSSFRKGLIDYRALAVADGKPIIDDAFIKIEFKA